MPITTGPATMPITTDPATMPITTGPATMLITTGSATMPCRWVVQNWVRIQWLLCNVLVMVLMVSTVTASPTVTASLTSSPPPLPPSLRLWEHFYLDGCGEGPHVKLAREVPVSRLLTPHGYFLMEVLSAYNPKLITPHARSCYPPSSPFPSPSPSLPQSPATPPYNTSPADHHSDITTLPPPSQPHNSMTTLSSSPSTFLPAATISPSPSPPSTTSLLRVFTKEENGRVVLTFTRSGETEGKQETGGEERGDTGGRSRDQTSCNLPLGGIVTLRSGYGFLSCRGEPGHRLTEEALKEWQRAVTAAEEVVAATRLRIIMGVAAGVMCMVAMCVTCIICRLRATRKPMISIQRRPSASTRSTNTQQDAQNSTLRRQR